MKKNLLFFIFMLMFVATPAAFAGHDHGGSHDSAGQASSHRQADEQKVNASELLLKNCAQHIYSIQQYIEKLQAKMSDKRAVSLIHGELEQLEQQLKEAKETVRALQVF